MTWKGRANNKVQCDRTGAIVHASDCRMTWDGLFVWKPFWYPRNPQDTIKPVRDGVPPAISRPVGEPEFVNYPPNNVPATFSDQTQITWANGADVEWSENAVAESDIVPGN